jgi:hypothetical protein
MAVQTPAGNTATQFHSDFFSRVFSPQATSLRYHHSDVLRSLLLFEDIIDSTSGKLQASAVFVLGEVVAWSSHCTRPCAGVITCRNDDPSEVVPTFWPCPLWDHVVQPARAPQRVAVAARETRAGNAPQTPGTRAGVKPTSQPASLWGAARPHGLVHQRPDPTATFVGALRGTNQRLSNSEEGSCFVCAAFLPATTSSLLTAPHSPPPLPPAPPPVTV